LAQIVTFPGRVTGGEEPVFMRRTVLAIVATTLGGLALAACGSDHAASTTAPTTLAATPAGGATNSFKPLDHGGGDDGGVEGEGHVSSLVAGTACPTLAFMIGTFRVTLTAATVFERGTCATIKVGSDLEVKGTRQADGSILASKVEFDDDNHDNSPNPNNPVAGESRVTSIVAGTACPTLSVMMDTIKVTLTAATVFERGTCADLVVGARVHVQGTMTGDNVVATRIVIKDHQGHPVVEGDGRVTSLVAGTSCPALQFIADGEWTVTVDATTNFVGGTCADLAVGRKVGVKGIVTAEHRVLGQQIVFKGPGN
jgi:hypothetical protein